MPKLNNRKPLAAAIMTMFTGLSANAIAQSTQSQTPQITEEVIVTGFKQSLALAIDKKRDSTGQVDAILAEDIGDFPDLNLAESLQRIPGVAISRSNGEGKNITVRGLSGLYTRVHVNGMESRAGIGSSASRDFDFNMFASELFNSITVHKTASADVDEGSLGATVKLQTARALDYEEGPTFLLGGNLQYNDLLDETSPRLTALYAYHDPSDKWGVSASIAFSEVKSRNSTANTVRWQRSRFNKVKGQDCPTSAEIKTGKSNPEDCATVSDNFHARIPRYGENDLHRERLGITLGAQFRPAETTTVSVDAMLASFDETQDFRTLEVLFRGNESGMDVTDFNLVEFPDRIDDKGNAIGNGTIEFMSVDNAWVRSERYQQITESEFSQFSIELDHAFSDTLSLNALAGISGSDGGRPRITTLMYDNRAYDGFTYDYSNSTSKPVLKYEGADVTDGTTFFLTDLRDGTSATQTDNETFKVDLEWILSDAFIISGGVSYKSFALDTTENTRNGNTCTYGYTDCSDGSYGIQGTAANSELFTFSGATGPESTTTWVVPSLAGWTDQTGFYNEPLRPKNSSIREVEEKNTGVFVKAAGELELGGVRFLYDAGLRYVETDQTSAGFAGDFWRVIERPTYDYTLPSFNLAFWLTDDFVFRASAAETIARPALGNLSPGGSVDSFNAPGEVNFKNPYLSPTEATTFDLALEWYFSEGALLSLALFHKDIGSFPVNSPEFDMVYPVDEIPKSLIEPTGPFGIGANGEDKSEGGELDCNPANGGTGCWTINRLGDGEGATVSGFELSAQAPFDAFSDNLPAVIADMGFIANYTNVSSDVERTFLGQTLKEKLTNLSNAQYNATIYYERDRFSTRLSLAYRSDYLNNGNANRNGNLYQFVEPSTYWDYSASYEISDQVTLSLEVLNLTDQPFEATVDETANRVLQYDLTGRNIMLGARFTF